ncbi:MAG: hypothetical protein CMJ70_11140 [Planctomycetaceae bacterium]|nr:hypothetical protein [Planctomycetaceae bacterium]|tara:strand:+ start:2756 stop:4402 length:1647 start_codon:yes stop_codon:yes gene_type:complete
MALEELGESNMRRPATMIVTFFVLTYAAYPPLTPSQDNATNNPHEIVNIGGRLELLVDDFLIDSMQGKVELKMHRPERKEIVFRTDAPWEGNASAYQSIFQDGDIYRMYYRGMHYRDHPHESGPAAKKLPPHAHYLCYAESDDGIHWRRPKLGLYDFNGSKANNIVLHPDTRGNNCSPVQTAVFLDNNPDCPPDERIKIIGQGDLRGNGLYVMKSGDGVRFSPLSPDPIVTKGAFDSQNLAFWDSTLGAYREYHRITLPSGIRGVATATSVNLLQFPDPVPVQLLEARPDDDLYTNAVTPYFRAPHMLVGFPARYIEREWADPLYALPGLDERLARSRSHPRYGSAITEALFMSSRDGITFKRWREAFIRPGPRMRENWAYGDHYVFWGIVETRSHLQDAPNEISLYATEGYWEGVHTDVRRYTLRTDGFVSASASAQGGEFVTRPFVFQGGNLTINFESSAAAGIRVELQAADGTAIPGSALEDCPEIFGDSIRHTVRWKRGGDVRALQGHPVRLRFSLRDADLYSFQFVPFQPDPVRPPRPVAKGE